MLRIKNNFLVNEAGKPLMLRGVNLGGWLMMEGYILYAPIIAACVFKSKFKRELGKKALLDFEKSFRETFIQETDYKNISSLGFNCVRLPFNHKLIEKKPYSYSKKGLSYLQKAIAWAKKYKLWIILDLHGCPGSQNQDWHSDSKGRALLWTSATNKKRTIALWRYLAGVFKDEETIAGYDLINEPIIDNASLNTFYKELIFEIRKIDKNHILFLEPGDWAQDLQHLKRPKDDNIAFSLHAYQPIDFCFNFVPSLRYVNGSTTNGWHMSRYRRYLMSYARLARKLKAPILIGEFGVNSRSNTCGEMNHLKDLLKIFNECNFHWTYWTYKAVKNSIFPDGLYHYNENPPWVNRQGPFYGWDTYVSLWKKHRNKIIASWKTSAFEKDAQIAALLKR
ncbi:glycoside hydrolase family 5 protein [Candidatus Omnitrophota bacterium]